MQSAATVLGVLRERGPAAASASRAGGGTGDCNSLTTCYTPEQIRVAYGIQPLTSRGFDGRGETVVLPAVAEAALSPPLVRRPRWYRPPRPRQPGRSRSARGAAAGPRPLSRPWRPGRRQGRWRTLPAWPG
jgi:hypothetical protein